MLRSLMRIGIINVEFNLKLAQTKEKQKHLFKSQHNLFFLASSYPMKVYY